jgi:salicylate hydroxylase
MDGEQVLIAGAGIAGLVTALCLHQQGIPFQVIEQAHQLHELGAGLQISPNGSRVLIDLRLEESIQQVACHAARKEVRHGGSGQTWKLFDLGQDCTKRFNAPYWFVHRGDLQRVLLTALLQRAPGCLTLGVGVQGAQTLGEHVRVQLSDGRQRQAKVVLACDGVHSRLRSAMLANDPLQFTGLMAWRGLVPMDRLPAHLRVTQHQAVGTNWVGPGAHVITYPLRQAQLMNVVAIVERDDWHHESWSQVGEASDMLADFATWHEDVRTTLSHILQPYQWALLGRQPLSSWVQGRVCLMGDAAHPTLPFLAQGANMAIEDAAVMGRCLSESLEPSALKLFEHNRLERTALIVQRSLQNALRFHNPILADPQQAAQYIQAEWDPEKVRTRYDWLFEYNPLSVPLNQPFS